MTTAKIAELRSTWESHAARGDHAAAYSLEQEIDALERQAKREAVQQQAEAAESRRIVAVNAAKADIEKIERHRVARAELEKVVAELETATAAVGAAMARLPLAWTPCRISYPTGETFSDPAQQEAYNEALGDYRYEKFEPLRLGLRLPAVQDILADRARGCWDIISTADSRF